MKYPAKLAANGTGCTPNTPIANPTYAPKKTSLPANALIIIEVSCSGCVRYTRSVSTQVTQATMSGANMPSQIALPNRAPSIAADTTLTTASHRTGFSLNGPASPYPEP